MNIIFKHNKITNIKDILGRTPLYIAAKYNNIKSVKYLLGMNSNVFMKCKRGLGPSDVTTSIEIKALIQKAKSFHVVMRFVPKLKRAVVLEELGLDYFLSMVNPD